MIGSESVLQLKPILDIQHGERKSILGEDFENLAGNIARLVYIRRAHRLLGIFYVRKSNIYDFVVECRLADDAVKPKSNPPEIVDCKFFKVDKLPKEMRGFTIDRIADAREGTIYPLPVEIGKDEWV